MLQSRLNRIGDLLIIHVDSLTLHENLKKQAIEIVCIACVSTVDGNHENGKRF